RGPMQPGGRLARFGRGQAFGAIALSLLVALAACSPASFFGPSTAPVPVQAAMMSAPPVVSAVEGETLGTGPVRVALLLPLSGDAALSQVGTAMANSARIAMRYIAGNPALPKNITLVLKD